MGHTPQSEILATHPDEDAYYTTYSYPTEPPADAVVHAVAELTGQSPLDLDPLHTAAAIDPDALNALFRPTDTAPMREGHVTFHYAGHTITVKDYGRIVIKDATNDEPGVLT